MVVRISDKTQNYSKVTKLLVKPKYLAEEAAAANESSEEDDISFDDLDLDNL